MYPYLFQHMLTSVSIQTITTRKNEEAWVSWTTWLLGTMRTATIYMLQELLWWKWGPTYLSSMLHYHFLFGIAVKITDVFDCIHSKIICTFEFLNFIGRDNLGTGSLTPTTLMLNAKLSVRTPASEVGDRHSRSNYTCSDKQNHDSCDSHGW